MSPFLFNINCFNNNIKKYIKNKTKLKKKYFQKNNLVGSSVNISYWAAVYQLLLYTCVNMSGCKTGLTR